jgi:uncharacterized protein (DUF433 family)
MSLPIVLENQLQRTSINPQAIAQIDTGLTPKTVLQDFSGFDQVQDVFEFDALSTPVLDKGAIDIALLSRQLPSTQVVAQIDTGLTPKTILQDFSAYDQVSEPFFSLAIPYSAPGSKRSGIFLPVILRILAEEQK